MFSIESIDYFLRETKPARFASALGKAAQAESAPIHVTSPLCHVRMVVRDELGNHSWGCSADRLSVRWLDKRPGRDSGKKRRELVSLLDFAKQRYLAAPRFLNAFEQWVARHAEIVQHGRTQDQEDLTSTFVSSLLERALIDALCRLADQPFFTMLDHESFGIQLSKLNPELNNQHLWDALPQLPTTSISIRHTVGIFDPLNDEDWPQASRLDDGLPETLEDYIRDQGIRFFKVKISGNAEFDLQRLNRLWEMLPLNRQPEITLDANEAFESAEAFEEFVDRLEKENLGLFQHISFIEQPLARRIALQPQVARSLARVVERKPVIIDESDDSLNSCPQAIELGYSGTSHKNCKGVFKSLRNLAMLQQVAQTGRRVVLSGEDLQNLPIVPLQQDLVCVGTLGITHCERNGHHYNFGLSMIPPTEKEAALREHPDLYEFRANEAFLRIEDGNLDCTSLHQPGFGVAAEPDWSSMEPLGQWLQRRHPAD